MAKKIAAITMARNDEFNLSRWIAYYGQELGHENLYVYLDGLDQTAPLGANITKLAHTDMSRARGDKYRVGLLSDLAKKLFANGYDIVIGCDCDEFLIADPNTGKTLAEYLSDARADTYSLSGLGMDVGMDLNSEYELDKSMPFLAQRKYALLSTRYTKPVVLMRGARWGSGFHKVRGHNFHIDPNLYLLHFGSADYEAIRNKIGDRNPDWKKHLARRAQTIFVITRKKRRNASLRLARFLQTILRPIYAWNKPAMLGLKLVATIPERFKKSQV